MNLFKICVRYKISISLNIIIVLSTLNGFSQNQEKIDSLEQVLNSLDSDSLKLEIYFDLLELV